MKVDHQQLIEKFCRCVPDFAALKLPDQRCLAEMFWRSISQIGDDEYGGHISGGQIKEIWGTVERMKAVVQHKYFSCEPGSNLTKLSSLYTPCPEMLSAFDCLVRQIGANPSTFKAKRIPGHTEAVASKTKSGSRRHGVGQPAKWLPIRTDLLTYFLDNSSSAHRIQASRLLYLSAVYGRSGKVPIRYTEVGSGRIFDNRGIQSLSRDVRATALSGCFDYDIACCHPAILRELTRGRLHLPALEQYLSHRSELRRSIAIDINPSLSEVGDRQIKQVKQSIIALAYGSVLSTSLRVELAKTIPDLKVRQAFVDHPFVRALRDDIRSASRDVVANRATADGWITNAFGVRQRFDLRRDFASAVSHIVTGYEALALDAVLQRWGESVLLAIHDGWVMQESIPTQEFEEEIFRKVGFRLSVDVERLRSQLEADQDCAPIPLVKKIELNQEDKDVFHIPKKINARPCPGGVLSVLSPLASSSCPSLPGVPSWSGVNGTGGLVVSARPEWNLPASYRGQSARVGRRPKVVT